MIVECKKVDGRRFNSSFNFRSIDCHATNFQREIEIERERERESKGPESCTEASSLHSRNSSKIIQIDNSRPRTITASLIEVISSRVRNGRRMSNNVSEV